MDKPKQEYLYNSEYVTIAHDIVGDEDLVVVTNDHGEYIVARKSSMQKKEDSYYFKKARERKVELESITKKAQDNLDKLADKLVDKALLDLASRLKFNVLFGKDVDGATAGWAVTISDELKKLVKDKAPDIIKKEDPFA